MVSSRLKHLNKCVGKAFLTPRLSAADPAMDPLKRKVLTSLLTAIVFAFASVAVGQQMFRTPPPDTGAAAKEEGKGEPTVFVPTSEEESPPPENAPATPKPTAAPKKEKQSQKSKPSPTAAEPAAAPPAPPVNRRNEEATLKELEDNWQSAIMAHNAAIVDLLVATDFAGVDRNGKFINKSAVIADVKNDKDTYQVAKNEKVNVRLYGPTTAVVTGSTRSKGTTKAGKAFDRAYRYTDTWVQREGKWQCVASQDSLLSPP
jgi:ketosteroid isomerase-like protein